MTMKVKAVEKKLKFTKDANDPGVWRYVMTPEQYSSLSQKKVIREAALRSGVSQGVMQACWDAAGEVIKAWATEGHSVALPGLGTMRFGLRAKSVENVNDVKAGLNPPPPQAEGSLRTLAAEALPVATTPAEAMTLRTD